MDNLEHLLRTLQRWKSSSNSTSPHRLRPLVHTSNLGRVPDLQLGILQLPWDATSDRMEPLDQLFSNKKLWWQWGKDKS